MPYKKHLHHLKLPSLIYWRKCGNMIMNHKIILKYSPWSPYPPPPEYSVTGGHPEKYSQIQERSHFISQQVINWQNQLFEDTVAAGLTGAF